MKFLESAKKLTEQISRVADVDEIRKQFKTVNAEQQKERFSICESCEFLFKPTNTCKKCGCFMSAKTWLAEQECPEGKWQKIRIVETD